MNFFDLNYREFGIKENQSLPHWLTYKLNNNGVIHLFGTPNNQDCGIFQIKLMEVNNYVLLKYNLNIKEAANTRDNTK